MASILLIEDEPWLGDLYVMLLKRAGLKPRRCGDGFAAIDAIDQEIPDAIVLDLLLPSGSGMLLLHELASHVDLAKIPIILCSNAIPPEITTDDLRAYGVIDVIDKTTTSPQAIVRRVQAALEHASIPN